MIIEEKDWEDLSEYRGFLEHHGVKNMKWYQHIFGKFQRHAKYGRGASVSDTKRQNKEESAKAKAEKKTEKDKVRSEKKAAKDQEREAKKVAKEEVERQKILKDPKKLYKNRDKFTIDEIKEALNRFEWEKKIASYSKDQLTKGEDYLKHIHTQTTNLINIWNAAARVVNSFGDDNKKMPFIMGLPGKQDDKNRNQSNN